MYFCKLKLKNNEKKDNINSGYAIVGIDLCAG